MTRRTACVICMIAGYSEPRAAPVRACEKDQIDRKQRDVRKGAKQPNLICIR